MVKNYSARLTKMKDRRLGDDGNVAFAEGRSYDSVLSKYDSISSEAYEIRGSSDTTRYALGAMQAVDQKYTDISIGDGDKVIDKLSSEIFKFESSLQFEYQGSVPLNIHIRRHSDIDILALHGGMITYDPAAAKIHGKNYGSVPKSALQYLIELREACENILENSYRTAVVDISGAKSICLSGGEFRRKVDVVPSHWHNTSEYMRSGEKHDRQVMILDKRNQTTISNLPFLHMKKINDKDALTRGGVKKVIRLLKTLRADSEDEITLSSFDIASIVWNFNNDGLNVSPTREFALISAAQSELSAMCTDRDRTSKLLTPDGSRKILDTKSKFESLQKLLVEIDAIASDIAIEYDPLFPWKAGGIRAALESAYVS